MGKLQEGWWPNLKKVFQTVGATAVVIIALFGGYYAVNNFVDKKIEKAVADVDAKIQASVNSEEFVKKAQAGVRPFLIFDARGKVLIDLGALEYIDPPVVVSTEGNPIPEKVIVTPKAYMAHAPLITGIDQVGAVAKATRGQGLNWKYTFEATYVMTGDIDPETQLQKRSRFRLEILK
ncbi:MAG: hypothetical protein SCARUB_02586 [Candidatus Scalindua rubra]|uniref:Uncharacterized protein n=1 Tax=Candidatus Scalindua rubra TaxID=1872076 RepID=A0A1E3XBF3_9BACT|nr:MAG: hypothetical protein SCARUB_02586 [Candidatus Scalindua rubra]